MTRPRASQAIHVEIGVVRTSLHTPIRAFRRQYTDLYRDCRIDQQPADAIQIEVHRSPLSLRHRRRYQVFVNGRLRFEPTRFDEVLPYVEWSINWELARVVPQFLQLHASSLEVDGEGVILPGVSGSGKSTLTVGLMMRGWRYLCDEFALLNVDTLKLSPFPRAICLKKDSFPVAESLGIKLQGRRHHHKGTKGQVVFLNPQAVYRDSVGRACPIRYVIFPTYTPGASPTLIPISRAEAAFNLHHVCFNLFGCQAPAAEVLAKMIREAACYRLISGDIGSTCDLLQGLVEGQAAPQAQSA
ncbi:MAG: hypothetical protein KJ749_09195 [Planctomycetes bacterium]|nr:hypothetical protein [Planctomycetota bacterium]